tara:strand:- start:71 stop:397 length:327 start_codon:yes stop_codon:yes gene_type:complete
MSKILVKNDTKLVVYALDDDQSVDIQSDKTIVGAFDSGSRGFPNISDLNSSNCTLITGVTVPSGTDVESDGSTARWVNNKYTYDDGTWTKVSGWKDEPGISNRFWDGK